MLPRRGLAPPRRTRCHVVDELVMLLREAVLLTLDKERDLAPLQRPIGVAEGAGAVLLAFRCFDALSVAFDASLLDDGADLLLGLFGQAASLDVIGELVEALPVGFQQSRDRTQRGNDLALPTPCHQADRLAQLDGEPARKRHLSSPYARPASET